MRQTTKLRKLLERDEVTIAPGAMDALVARLIERAGFEAVYMTGNGTALARFALPDVGLVTMTEMVDNARAIVAAVNVPVIADADTGYGNPLNVYRTVQEYERAGVAAVHIEDQVFPKKCGHLLGKRLVPVEEMVEKIHAARDACQDPDFAIIARCDALLIHGMDEALARGRAYVQAGADVLFIESPRTMEEIQTIGRSFTVPLLFNMGSSGKTPFVSAADLQRIGGWKIMILPNFATLAAIKAIREVLAEIRTAGSVAGVRPRCATFEDLMELAGLPRIQAMERRYGLPEDALTRI